MVITVDNVRQILGVSVEGDCFTSKEGGIEMASKLLGVDEGDVNEETKDTYTVRMQWLKEKCMGRATEESSPEELDKCARGYILFLLGCVVLSDKTKSKISLYYLGCLKDLTKVS